MIRSPRWSPLAALLATVAIVFAACAGTTASTAPSTAASAPASTAASAAPATASAAAFTPIQYPETGEAPCAQAAAPDAKHNPYVGEFKKISAPDARTVVFDLCNSDVAFLSKIAFTSFAINDAGWLKANIDPAATTQKIVTAVNGTGPYKLNAWNRGQDVTYDAYDGYWGTNKALTPKAILRWNKEAAQRLVELQAGTVDGIDNVGPTDFATVEGDANLQLKPRTGLNVFYLGFNNTFEPWKSEAVRQAIAKGIDRKRIVDTFYPGGSSVADYFTPCDISNGCVGPKWYDFDAAAAKQELTAAGFDFSKTYKLHFRPAVRGYLPDPPVIATEIQAQLKNNLGINVQLDQRDDTTYLDEAAAGKLDGIQMLGWGADYPDQTNFVGYHFGSGASKQFGDKYPDLVAALDEGARGASDAAREPAYTKVNELIKQHVPMIPIAHGGSATAFRADVTGAHSSPLTNEQFAVMKAGDRPQLVFSQNGEPGGLYCADETDGEALRACDQTMEGLYGYAIAGTATIPVLAEKCEPNAELTTWTCTLHSGVTFHDGSSFDADDVVTSYAVQWDADNPLHKGRTGDFTYMSSLFGLLNPPVPKPAS